MVKKWAALLLAAVLILLPACGSRQAQPETGHPTLIAHAGGAVYGYRYTNSKEALDTAYAAGHRFIELDFQPTLDGEIVLIHDWDSMAVRLLGSDGQRTKEAFLSSETFSDLTLLDLSGLLKWMDGHPEASIVTDIKGDNLETLKRIREMAGEKADRFIPQIYSYDQFDSAAALGYERIILTVYRMEVEPETLGSFVKEKRPWAVTMPQERLTEELLTAIRTACPETAVYCHTVNDLSFYETWEPLGLTGLYTDYFVPDRWPYPAIAEDRTE